MMNNLILGEPKKQRNGALIVPIQNPNTPKGYKEFRINLPPSNEKKYSVTTTDYDDLMQSINTKVFLDKSERYIFNYNYTRITLRSLNRYISLELGKESPFFEDFLYKVANNGFDSIYLYAEMDLQITYHNIEYYRGEHEIILFGKLSTDESVTIFLEFRNNYKLANITVLTMIDA